MNLADPVAEAPPAASLALFAPGRRAACLGAVALISMLAFESIAVATAMPAVAEALHGLPLYALAFGATLATSVLGMTAAGQLCDKRGPFIAAMAGLAAFLAGLLLAGFATSMPLLVAGRALQGLGSGVLGVTLYVGVGQVVPQALHPKLFAMFAGAWVVPGLVGPALASFLVQFLGWRSVFLAVAAVVPVAAALMLPALRRVGSGTGEALRWGTMRWAVLASLGALTLHAASQAGAGAPLLFCIGLAVAGIAARLLLPVGTLRAARGLPTVILLRGLIAATFASAEAFLPLLLTQHFGWSLTQAGIALSAGAVTWSIGSALQARVTRPERRRLLLPGGFGLTVLGLLVVIAPLGIALPSGLVFAGWATVGLGIGLSFPMLSVLLLKLSPPESQGSNTSALQLSDALTSSAALAGAGLLFDPATRQVLPVLLMALALVATATALSPRAQPVAE
ncbi:MULTISPECIES: MFS transporter [Roseateles]|uniref:MFS transporter n=1 Tax=Pelomonas caseinilytica TaxID=2906763 RepID=A0ABS8XLX9_9BURK|nr:MULTISPECIES: MFS transporter [unclassified Roseateles]MCE4540078.1 MFS transporter [Pelomonas sp. P7]HEV6966370.1 MFS transporter [Roseateles sp.]